MVDKYFEGIGRRKTSTARVRIYKGKGVSTVNERAVEDFFPKQGAVSDLEEVFKTAGIEGYYYTVKVNGGGTTGQLDAVKLGIARAIVKMDETLKPALRKAGMVTRDPRMVERKKYSFKKARRKPQFSKR